MQLKTLPEDFIVIERANHAVLQQGPYVLLEMAKRNISTERALSVVAERLDIPRRLVGYAGTKDARALTRQYITVKNSPLILSRIKNFSRDQVSIRVLGFVQEPLGLGMLDSNKFEIVVRKISDEHIFPITKIPNYFDEQRFSTSNVDIGRLILKKDYVGAARKILETEQYSGDRIREYLESKPTDGIGALRLVPKHILLMYIHAYQSHLFNQVLAKYILSKDADAGIIDGPVMITAPSKDLDDVIVPMVGFGTRRDEPFFSWYCEMLEKDNLEERDFVVRSIPFLTSEGAERSAFFMIQELAVNPSEDDDLHPGFKKQSLSFVLPKGCYATMVIKCLFRVGNINGDSEE